MALKVNLAVKIFRATELRASLLIGTVLCLFIAMQPVVPHQSFPLVSGQTVDAQSPAIIRF